MSKTKDLVLTALLITIVFISTSVIRIPLAPNGGLVHLGSVALFAASVLFGKKKGALAGAFGMALFNLMTEWVIWAPFTFIIRAVMGYIIGSIAHTRGANGRSLPLNIAAGIAGGLWFIPASYMAEVMLFGNWLAPVNSITGNLLQLALMFGAGLPIAMMIGRHKSFSQPSQQDSQEKAT